MARADWPTARRCWSWRRDAASQDDAPIVRLPIVLLDVPITSPRGARVRRRAARVGAVGADHGRRGRRAHAAPRWRSSASAPPTEIAFCRPPAETLQPGARLAARGARTRVALRRLGPRTSARVPLRGGRAAAPGRAGRGRLLLGARRRARGRRDRAAYPRGGARRHAASTRWRSCSARPRRTRACSRPRCVARAFRRSSRAARDARTRPAARSWSCSTARSRSSRRGGSPSTSRSARCRARRRRRPRAARGMWVAPEEDALILGAEAPAEPEDDASRIARSRRITRGRWSWHRRPQRRRAAASPTLGSAVGRPDRARARSPDVRRPAGDPSRCLDGDLRAPWRWEQLLVESAVIGGTRALEPPPRPGSRPSMRVRIDELRRGGARLPAPRAAIERDLANLEHLERFALPVIDRLAALPAQATWGEWIAAARGARADGAAPAGAGAGRARRRCAPLGPDRAGGARRGARRARRASWRRWPSGRRPTRYGRVFVGTLEQARGRSFDVVFLPGLAERVFPQKPREDPILLDALRRELGRDARDAGRPRPSRAPAAAARRRRGHAARCISRTRASSRPRRGRACRRSTRWRSMRALTGAIPDPQTLERDAARGGGGAAGVARAGRSGARHRRGGARPGDAAGRCCASSRARRAAARAICSS